MHKYLFETVACPRRPYLLGSLSDDDCNGNEDVTWKYIFISFVLLRDYFNSLNFYTNNELSRNQIGRSAVQVKKENEKFIVMRSRSPQNLKRGHFTSLFCRGRQRNVPKISNACTERLFLLIKPIVLRRCRCHRRRRCLSSLILKATEQQSVKSSVIFQLSLLKIENLSTSFNMCT